MPFDIELSPPVEELNTLAIAPRGEFPTSLHLSQNELDYGVKRLEKHDFATINQYHRFVYLVKDLKKESKASASLEKWRKLGFELVKDWEKNELREIQILDFLNDRNQLFALLEGIALSSYCFDQLKTKREKKGIEKILIHSEALEQSDLSELMAIVKGCFWARNLVNLPLSQLNALEMSKAFQEMGKEAGFKTEVLNKKKIESLKMGGLLAVNKGSIDPPTFSILEWKPENAVNSKPLVLVGKGVVYDTGGLSLKPTANSMDIMKSDMGGAAAVSGAIYAIAMAKLPVHIIALIPSTDNRPGQNAYAPGDVITMHDGTTVEVMNTDAEGRLLLGDALSYAKTYEPSLVIDLATLTGSAVRAIGQYASVGMGTDEKALEQLEQSGEMVYERVVPFPFWEEYGEHIKSEIADLKNLGKAEAGSISAGKFLEHFTDYPWVHLDIAGPAYLMSPDNYRGKGGTGTGVRLLYQFIKNHIQ